VDSLDAHDERMVWPERDSVLNSLEKAIQFAERAKTLAPDLAVGPATLGHAYLLKKITTELYPKGNWLQNSALTTRRLQPISGGPLRSIRRYGGGDERI